MGLRNDKSIFAYWGKSISDSKPIDLIPDSLQVGQKTKCKAPHVDKILLEICECIWTVSDGLLNFTVFSVFLMKFPQDMNLSFDMHQATGFIGCYIESQTAVSNG